MMVRRATPTAALCLVLACSAPQPMTPGPVAIGPWQLTVRSSLVARQGAQLRVFLTDLESICDFAKATYRCTRSTFDVVALPPAVSLDVLLPSIEPGTYATDVVTATFRGVSNTEQFSSTARSGTVELVSYAPGGQATIVVDLEMDTGATLRGRFVANPCVDIELVRPFGGLVCTSTSMPIVCQDGGTNVNCAEVDERCTCGAQVWRSFCETRNSFSPTRYRLSCACTPPAGAMTSCALDVYPSVKPHCCEGAP
ncbi:MAG: hypothetical protein Q8L14_27525 [Myxococcales bacterium]|nr:hypothetical protein [Myxococcales bacterium]